ncbi:Enterochelin esterase [Flexibacter flexilis DSM 6793]|uniref:Enterochelin esterase n=1 Tax=Flexibacter flexilis DSM 6793 TaxID=927664 RepID=A0A1I1LJZ6_9BACT|nr:alpha/beta hydrolase-fold protein [Flexibacter flexilis]SFC73339.1 Enterochelin esterase [Flexibacter flexilis DSM 6793]
MPKHLSNHLVPELAAVQGSAIEQWVIKSFHSAVQHKDYTVRIFLPLGYHDSNAHYKVLYANDGQDMEAIKLAATLENLQNAGQTNPLIVVAIDANERILDYGTAEILDFANRGRKAKKYISFILEELMPYINSHYRTLQGAENAAFMGFSLGGLSAIDIVWHYPHLFGKVGVFSGSFWWRRRDIGKGYVPADRIMQAQIRESQAKKEGLRFWLQTGTNDETNDRDGDGIIDSIGDTLDLIHELKAKGYTDRDIEYVEVQGGEHNQQTWGEIMPDFLKWAFGR